MIALAHFLIGALIGMSLDNFLFIAVLAFISHFILDAIPHLDQGSFKKKKEDWTSRDWFLVFVDVVIGASLALYFAIRFEFWPIAVGVAFAILPDVIDTLSWMFNARRKPFFKQFHEIHDKIGFKLTRELLWLGVILEVAVILSILSILLFV